MANRNLNEIIGSDDEFYRTLIDTVKNQIRVAIPGVIQSFNAEEQTAKIQPTLREEIILPDYSKQIVQLPLLLDVPVCIPRAGGYSITFPVKQGDECLVIFSDMCIDAWWSYGSIQNQIEKRRHDLSDAFAILAPTSQPKRLTNYSTDSIQIRKDDGSSYIELKNNEINLVGSVKINGTQLNP